jgi:hypothetical protein
MISCRTPSIRSLEFCKLKGPDIEVAEPRWPITIAFLTGSNVRSFNFDHEKFQLAARYFDTLLEGRRKASDFVFVRGIEMHYLPDYALLSVRLRQTLGPFLSAEVAVKQMPNLPTRTTYYYHH